MHHHDTEGHCGHHHHDHHHDHHHHDHDHDRDPEHRGRRAGKGRGRRRFRDIESLEALQRDLEQAAADIAERIKRIREREAARDTEPRSEAPTGS